MSLGEYLKIYEYDRSKPLNVGLSKFSEKANYIAYRVYYSSAGDIRVPAIFTVPKIDGQEYPCIVFLHGYGGGKEDVLPLADLFSTEGYAFLSIDAPFHGERVEPGKVLYAPNVEELKSNVIQTIFDLRRGVDFLEQRVEIRADRIGYAGGSMGGIMGALFIGVEPRIKAAVIVVGGGNLPLIIRESKHYSTPPIREELERRGLSYDKLSEILAPIDPMNFIHLFAPKPIQFHCGKYDDIVPAETQRLLAEKAGEPKEVYWYESGHGIPPEPMLKRVLKFFRDNLKTS
ncbi:acetylxylan esterase [Candidatus Bathyarchaeota archaeon]|nr:acetylxylan esterase [Candidatus Bathyarchaeota archaeon]